MCDSRRKLDIVAIDGPSGVGKSTVSRKVALLLGYAYLDTGAMYRAVGYYLKSRSVSLVNEEDIVSVLLTLRLQILPARKDDEDVEVLANGENISSAIRTPEMAMLASRVSTIAVVRKILTEMQRDQGKNGRIVAEGRDIGTTVFPDAAFKFFLEAQPEERARRRLVQLNAKGIEIDAAEVLREINSRDNNDRNRSVAPLTMAEDAVLINTTNIPSDEVVSIIVTAVSKGLALPEGAAPRSV